MNYILKEASQNASSEIIAKIRNVCLPIKFANIFQIVKIIIVNYYHDSEKLNFCKFAHKKCKYFPNCN